MGSVIIGNYGGANGSASGSTNGAWKGDNVSIGGLYKWVRLHKPKPTPFVCEECGKGERLDLANVTGVYTRDFNNYKWLCRRCYMNRDKIFGEVGKNGL